MKLCNFKSTTTNDYIRQTASLLGRALLLAGHAFPTPWLKSAPGLPVYLFDPHREGQSLPRRNSRLPRRLSSPDRT